MENEAGNHLNGEVEMCEKRKVCEMFFPLWDLGAKVVVAHPGKTWKPAWAQEPNCNLLPPGSASNFPQQNWEVEELMFDHIEKFGLVDKSIHCLFIRPEVLESPKDAIPDRKKSTIVLVQAVSV